MVLFSKYQSRRSQRSALFQRALSKLNARHPLMQPIEPTFRNARKTKMKILLIAFELINLSCLITEQTALGTARMLPT
jgi:hypothetical protein